ncbi:MAG: nucleoside hydrolase [Brevinema sp.]
MKKNIWIDTDPGLDDTLALIWATQKEKEINWKILGISTINGNLGLAQVNGNLSAVLTHLDRRDIPLYSGCSQALLQGEYNASYVHGNALGPIDVAPMEHLNTIKAPEALAQCLSTLEGQLTLITLGPLTNIAIFLRLYPEYRTKIEQIVIMGGGSYGNVTYYSEFNIYIDPEAAKIVFESGIPIIKSGLDISDHYSYIYASELKQYLALSSNEWTPRILEYLLNKFYQGNPQAKMPLYDPTAMVAAAHPELFESFDSPVSVELQGATRGMTLIPTRSTFDHPFPNNITTKVLKSCPREQFLETLFSGL